MMGMTEYTNNIMVSIVCDTYNVETLVIYKYKGEEK